MALHLPDLKWCAQEVAQVFRAKWKYPFNINNLKECLAERTGLEPATPGVTGRYSNQLNYRSVVGVAGLEPATYGL